MLYVAALQVSRSDSKLLVLVVWCGTGGSIGHNSHKPADKSKAVV
jgi:hypothetical protein